MANWLEKPSPDAFLVWLMLYLRPQSPPWTRFWAIEGPSLWLVQSQRWQLTMTDSLSKAPTSRGPMADAICGKIGGCLWASQTQFVFGLCAVTLTRRQEQFLCVYSHKLWIVSFSSVANDVGPWLTLSALNLSLIILSMGFKQVVVMDTMDNEIW